QRSSDLPDSISEFRVISHNYDADLGRNSGSVINAITKSGSNAVHGTVYEYFRNKSLNARGYFDPEKPDFQQNEFGGTVGGAIRKDKTFFFSSYEGRRLRRGITSDPVSVPTLQERSEEHTSELQSPDHFPTRRSSDLDGLRVFPQQEP